MIEIIESEEELEEIEQELLNGQKKLDELSLLLLLNEPYDKNDCILEIHSGAGGTEACDWANMLLRMYTRYAEKHGYKINVLDIQDGEEAGIKSCSLEIKGENAYGYLKNEKGVHRLVRLSPFDSNNRRHTSFASVEVTPKIDNSIKITTSVKECMEENKLLIIAIPAAFVDELCKEISLYIKDHHIIIATKGIEQGTGYFMHELVEKHLNTKNIAVISGPSFATDLVTKMPEGLSVASKCPETILIAKQALQNNYIKLRDTNDITGVEICGAIKNVIAIASGILDGLKASESTKAMLIVEAIHDVEAILDAFDCNKRTVLSFAGIGDLLLTCTSTKSRNFSLGKLIGEKPKKEKIEEYLSKTTVEGYYTLESIYQLLKNKEVTIPIIDLIYEIVVQGKDPELLLAFLVFKS